MWIRIDCENVWRQIDTSIVDISNEFEVFEWLVKWHYDLDNVCLVEWYDICDCYSKLRDKIIVICGNEWFPFWNNEMNCWYKILKMWW